MEIKNNFTHIRESFKKTFDLLKGKGFFKEFKDYEDYEIKKYGRISVLKKPVQKSLIENNN